MTMDTEHVEKLRSTIKHLMCQARNCPELYKRSIESIENKFSAPMAIEEAVSIANIKTLWCSKTMEGETCPTSFCVVECKELVTPQKFKY